jgi:hypothetical protein
VSTLPDYEARVRDLCFGPEPSPDALAALGDEPWRWLRYRRMVRRRLSEVIEQALPRLCAALGSDTCGLLLDRFLADAGPRSPFIREVAGEFTTWLLRAAPDLAGLPAHAPDLAQLEWATRAISYAEDTTPPAAPLTLDRPVVLSSTHRALALAHAVHRDTPPERTDTFLCVYRDSATHDVRTLELTRSAYRLLEASSDGTQTLTAAIAMTAAHEGLPVDAKYLEATSALLADLIERGIVRGSVEAGLP